MLMALPLFMTRLLIFVKWRKKYSRMNVNIVLS